MPVVEYELTRVIIQKLPSLLCYQRGAAAACSRDARRSAREISLLVRDKPNPLRKCARAWRTVGGGFSAAAAATTSSAAAATTASSRNSPPPCSVTAAVASTRDGFDAPGELVVVLHRVSVTLEEQKANGGDGSYTFRGCRCRPLVSLRCEY